LLFSFPWHINILAIVCRFLSGTAVSPVATDVAAAASRTRSATRSVRIRTGVAVDRRRPSGCRWGGRNAVASGGVAAAVPGALVVAGCTVFVFRLALGAAAGTRAAGSALLC
jgi:hypothetical protein